MYLFRPDLGSTFATNSRLMLIQGGFNLAFDCTDFTPMILAVQIRPEESRKLVEPEVISLFPAIENTTYLDAFGNKCLKLVPPPGRLSIWSRFVIGDEGRPEELPLHAYQHS